MPFLFLILLQPTLGLASQDAEWRAYGNDAGASHYSPLDQIQKNNVSRLKVAWTYRTRDREAGGPSAKKQAFEATPLMIGGRLYFTTPFGRAIALDAATGKELWVFDPKVDRSRGYSEVTSRGLSWWKDSKSGEQRLFYGTMDARLVCLAAADGQPCAGFGAAGIVDLKQGLDIRYPGDYQVTSPPAIVNDTVVIGSAIGDNFAVKTDRGAVRGYDPRTGALKWTWDPIDPKMNAGAANAWGVFSADPARDLVFVPTGSASPDYYGGERKGDNKWANSVVALQASTGKFVWGYQVVHHDLWDYDIGSTPLLFDLRKNGSVIPALAVPTKMGFVFILNRLTGEPLIPVEERVVPRSGIPGEASWPTQPFPQTDRLVPTKVTPEDAFGVALIDRKICADRIRALYHEGIFSPPTLGGTLVVPGNAGGSNWGGPALDPKRGLMLANMMHVPFFVKLIPRAEFDTVRKAGGKGEFAAQLGTPYGLYREAFLSPLGVPCVKPPWGMLAAMDLHTGKLKWQVPLGKPLALGTSSWGTPNLGGPLVTAGGLVFIGATALDDRFRAFDVENGRELWSVKLPAGGQASPMTYSVNGRQFVVIAAGGHGKLGTTQGDSVVAFTLP